MTTAQENQFLFKEKLMQGKSEKQAIGEIKKLQNYQKAYKILWKENQDLKKQVKKKDKDISKLKQKCFQALQSGGKR